MKYSYLTLVFMLTLCCTFFATAQSPDAKEEDKKVIVIKKKVDSDGETVVQKIELMGEEGEVLIRELEEGEDELHYHAGDAIRFSQDNADVHQDVHVYRIEKKETGDADVSVIVEKTDNDMTRIELTKNDAEPVVIELKEGQELSDEQRALLEENGVRISNDNTWVMHGPLSITRDIGITDPSGLTITEDIEVKGPGPIDGLAERIHLTIDKMAAFDFDFDFDHPRAVSVGRNTNCIALGVYVTSHTDGDLRISSIIEGSGAEEAGLLAGDILRGVDKKPVDNHRELLSALSDYEPGEIVTVDYERDGVLSTVQAEVRQWRDLPAFADSWHAQIECGEEPAQEVHRKVIIIKKGQDVAEELPPDVNQAPPAVVNNTLELQNFTAYPNPTEGKFRIEFEAGASPLVVSIIDVSGKEVFRDNVDDFAGYYSKQIDLTGMAQGAFVLSVEQDGRMFTDQVVLH